MVRGQFKSAPQTRKVPDAPGVLPSQTPHQETARLLGTRRKRMGFSRRPVYVLFNSEIYSGRGR